MGKLFKLCHVGDKAFQLLLFNEEFLGSASDQVQWLRSSPFDKLLLATTDRITQWSLPAGLSVSETIIQVLGSRWNLVI